MWTKLSDFRLERMNHQKSYTTFDFQANSLDIWIVFWIKQFLLSWWTWSSSVYELSSLLNESDHGAL